MSAAVQKLLGSLAGSSSPTLGSVLSGVEGANKAVVNASASVLEATELMVALHVSAVLVLEGGAVAGLLTTDDILQRVVSKGLNCGFTCVSNVMTPDPDVAGSGTSILDALHRMHGGWVLANLAAVLPTHRTVCVCVFVFVLV